MARISTTLGALFYLVWGALHIQAGLAVIDLGNRTAAGMAQARIYQDAWTLLVAAAVVVVVAGLSMWRSSMTGYWVNLVVATVTDVGFIALVLVPGYLPLWPGLQGPVSWVMGMSFATVGIVLRQHQATTRSPTPARSAAGGAV